MLLAGNKKRKKEKVKEKERRKKRRERRKALFKGCPIHTNDIVACVSPILHVAVRDRGSRDAFYAIEYKQEP